MPLPEPGQRTCIGNSCQFTTVGCAVDLDDQRSLELSGEKSYDLKPDATGVDCTVRNRAEIAAYTWKVTSKPSGSTATATPDSTRPYRVTVSFDRVGPYPIRLTVTDRSGISRYVRP